MKPDDKHILTKKTIMREEIRAVRKAVTDRETRSLRIFHRLKTLECWRTAKNVLVYLNIHSEVETGAIISEMLSECSPAERKCVVPWCREDGELGLFHLLSPEEELSPGTLGIREPREEWRTHPHRNISAEELDLILLPGIAFDKKGGRLGQGRAFYDRLLARANAITVGLAFACQIVEEVPREEHDRRVDFVVTEEEIIRNP